MFRFRWMMLVAVLFLLVGNIVAAQRAAPETTPEATQPAPIDLSETYSTDDGRLSLNYPHGWKLHTNWTGDYPGWRWSARIVRNQDLFSDGMERFLYRLESGVVEIDVDVYDIKSLEFSVRKTSADITPEDVLRFRMFGLSAKPLPPTMPTPLPNSGVALSDIQSFRLANGDAARVDVTSGGDQIGMVIVSVKNDIEIEITLFTAPGESERWIPTALAIAESVNYSG